MSDYRLRVYRKFPHKRMRQVVIYLKPSDSELVYQTEFVLENSLHRFEVIRLWEQPTETFFNSPGLLPFAALSQTEDKTRTLEEVAQVIEALTDTRIRSNVAASTAVLAGLVLDKELIKRILRSDIMRESVIYQDIFQEGLEQKAQEIAIKMIHKGIDIETIVDVTGLTIEQVQQLQAKTLYKSVKKASNLVPNTITMAQATGIKAGTGVAISSLSGGAATNSTLAFLGCGSTAATTFCAKSSMKMREAMKIFAFSISRLNSS